MLLLRGVIHFMFVSMKTGQFTIRFEAKIDLFEDRPLDFRLFRFVIDGQFQKHKFDEGDNINLLAKL